MEHVLSLSYGKDSLACLGAIEELVWPLDRIVHAEVWATDTIPADLPPMVEFKAKADEIIKARWGIEVEHVCAMKDGKKVTYESIFYREIKPKRERERECERCADSLGTTGHGAWIDSKQTSSTRIYGFPIVRGQWCNSGLKMPAIRMGNKVDTVLHRRTQENGDLFCKPQNEGREKYRSIYRNCSRRTEPIPQSDGHQAQPFGRGRMGRSVLPEVVRGQ